MKGPDDPVPLHLLQCMDLELVSKWLCKYIMETRQDSGSPYPPKTLYSLLCGLLRISCANGVPFNFLDRSDIRFQEFHNTLDSVCSSLHTKALEPRQIQPLLLVMKTRTCFGRLE